MTKNLPEDLPALQGWVGVQGAADRLGISRQHAGRMFTERKFGTLRRIEGSYTVVVSVAELDAMLLSGENVADHGK